MLILRIENDLGDTVDLLNGVVIASSYDPESPSPDTETTRGGEISRVAIPPLQEVISVSMAGDPSDTADATRKLGRMFAMAADRQLRKVGPRVWLIYQIHEDQGIWRSEIMGGRVRFARDGASMAATSGTFGAEIEITRRPWWEAIVEQFIELSWTENNGIAARIDGGHLVGDVEAPATLTITNQTAAEDPIQSKFSGALIGVSFRLADLPSFPAPFQGELATNPAPTSTPNVPEAINGLAGAVSWVGGDETALVGWSIPASLLIAGAGQRFRVVARGFLSTPSQNGITKYQVRLSSMDVEIFRGPWVRANTAEYIDFGVVTLPEAIGALPNLYLSLWGQNINGDSVVVDYAMLMPCDNWAMVSRVKGGVGVDDGETLVIDTAKRCAWIEKSVGTTTAMVMDGGINLVPGRTHYLSILLFDPYMSRLPKQYRYDLEIRYRPRKSVL